MRTIKFNELERRFQAVAGLASLDATDKFFFRNSLNTRLKQAWDFNDWPELTELIELSVAENYTELEINPSLADSLTNPFHTPDHWWDASDRLSYTVDSQNRVTELRDKVGSIHLGNDDPDHLPVISSDGGKPSIRFDGFDDVLRINGDGPMRGEEIYVFAVFSLHDLGFGSLFLQPSGASSGITEEDLALFDENSQDFIVAHVPWIGEDNIAYQFGSGNLITNSPLDLDLNKTLIFQISNSVRDNIHFSALNSQVLYSDPGASAIGAIPNTYIRNFQLGGREHQYGEQPHYDDFFLGMHFKEMQIFNRYLSPTDQRIIEANLAQKWGVTERSLVSSKATKRLTEQILNVYDLNPLREDRSRPIPFRLLDSRCIVDETYNYDTIWVLSKKRCATVDENDDIPEIFEKFLISAILADFYRGDGQQQNAQVEEARANEHLLMEVDHIDRQSRQSRIDINPYPTVINKPINKFI